VILCGEGSTGAMYGRGDGTWSGDPGVKDAPEAGEIGSYELLSAARVSMPGKMP